MDIDTDHCCCRAMDPDMVLRGTTVQDITMALGSNSGYLHQGDPHHLHVFSSTSLHSVPTTSLSLLSFYHILARCTGPCPPAYIIWQLASGCLLTAHAVCSLYVQFLYFIILFSHLLLEEPIYYLSG